MKTYKLIKEYPGSEKVGTIYEYDESWKMYRVGKQFYTLWTPSYFERWVGEYFIVL